MMKPRPKHVHTAIAGASLPRHAAAQSPLWGQAKRGCAWGPVDPSCLFLVHTF